MPTITLEIGSPYFTFPKDLEDLATDLRARSPETTIVVVPPWHQRGYPFTPLEVVHAWVSSDLLTGGVADWLVDGCSAWVRTRRKQAEVEVAELMKQDLTVRRTVRPIMVMIYDQDGEAVTAIQQLGTDPHPREVRERPVPKKPPTLASHALQGQLRRDGG